MVDVTKGSKVYLPRCRPLHHSTVLPQKEYIYTNMYRGKYTHAYIVHENLLIHKQNDVSKHCYLQVHKKKKQKAYVH